MAKKVQGYIKLQIPAGQANPSPPVGPALGQQGLFGIIPLVNKGEPAALYCFVFLYIAARGPGIWSADGARGGAGSAS